MGIDRIRKYPNTEPPVQEWEVVTDDNNAQPLIAQIRILGDGLGFRPVRIISHWANDQDTGGWHPSEARLLGEALIEAADEVERRIANN